MYSNFSHKSKFFCNFKQWEKFDIIIILGWGKEMFGKESEYQVVMKEVHMNMVDHKTCEKSLQGTRLGDNFKLDKSFNCAGGEAGIDVCTGTIQNWNWSM